MSLPHSIITQSNKNGPRVRIVPRKRRSSFGSSFKMLAWNWTVGSARALKRVMDICGSIALLIALFIPMLIIAILIKLGSEGPIIYHSKRIGQFGKPFNFLKFRSMYINSKEIEAKMLQEWDEKAAEIEKQTGQKPERPALSDLLKAKEDDPRVTKIGRILRKTSLDELPQLFNILAGQMSFVGPRPCVKYELGDFDTLNTKYKKRFRMKAGLTGLAQTKGRNDRYMIPHPAGAAPAGAEAPAPLLRRPRGRQTARRGGETIRKIYSPTVEVFSLNCPRPS